MRYTQLVLLSAAAITCACHHARRANVDADTSVSYSIEARRAIIDSTAIMPPSRVAPRAASIQLVPQGISLRVGDTVDVDSAVHVFVIDSTGASLGRLPVYDSRMTPGAAVLIELGRVAGLQPGVSELLIGFPRSQWRGRRDPPPTARLRIEVR
jgi:hypothetical protein